MDQHKRKQPAGTRYAQIRAIVETYPIGRRQIVHVYAQKMLSAKTQKARAYYAAQLAELRAYIDTHTEG